MTDEIGFVLHLSLDISNPVKADEVSRNFLRLMHGVFPEVDAAFSSISTEDNQNQRRYLFCSQRLDGDQRCMQRSGHTGEHSPKWAT